MPNGRAVCPDFDYAGKVASAVYAREASELLFKKTSADLDAIFETLPANDRDLSKARIKSCSGVGAQWLAQTPTCQLTQLSDEDMCSATRLRLGLPTLSVSICPHISASGNVCGKSCDAKGMHLLSCASGGGFFVGHDSVCAAYCQLAAGPDGIPGVQADWKPRVDVWPRATRGAEADIGFYCIQDFRPRHRACSRAAGTGRW